VQHSCSPPAGSDYAETSGDESYHWATTRSSQDAEWPHTGVKRCRDARPAFNLPRRCRRRAQPLRQTSIIPKTHLESKPKSGPSSAGADILRMVADRVSGDGPEGIGTDGAKRLDVARAAWATRPKADASTGVILDSWMLPP